MQHRIRRAAGRRDCGDGIFQRFPRDDLARPQVSLQQIHDHLPALEGHVVLPLIHGRDPVSSHRRNAEELERDRHGISRKLASTCARARAGMVFEIFEFGIGHLAGRMFPDCFEHVLNGHVVALKLARHD